MVKASEKAWKPIDRDWQIYSKKTNDSEAKERLRKAIKSLQAMRLPIEAIDAIAHALRAAEQLTLESSYCERCETRADGMIQCVRCKFMKHCSEVDEHNDMCHECTEETEDTDEDYETLQRGEEV